MDEKVLEVVDFFISRQYLKLKPKISDIIGKSHIIVKFENN